MLLLSGNFDLKLFTLPLEIGEDKINAKIYYDVIICACLWRQNLLFFKVFSEETFINNTLFSHRIFMRTLDILKKKYLDFKKITIKKSLKII